MSNRVRKGMTFGSSALEPANVAMGSIGVNGQRVNASASGSDAIDPAGAGSRSGSAAMDLADEALAYLENALGNGALSDHSKKPSSGQLMRGPAGVAGASKGRRVSNFNMAELAGLTSSLAATKMPPFPPRYPRRRHKESDR